MMPRRLFAMARSAALVVALGPVTAYSADLPFEPGRPPIDAQRHAAIRSYTAMQWPIHPQPHRFDIYGNPLADVFIAVPDPLVVNNGCPKAIEPTYDVDGNLAGYAPFVACR